MATKFDCGRRRRTQTEYPDAEYVHELPDAEKERRMSPWGYDSWDDVDLDAVECKRHPGSTDGRLACHHFDCPGGEMGELVELVGQPVDFEPGHPGDFCEEYECISCGRTGKMYIGHYPVANEFSTVQDFEKRTTFTGVLRE
jgi:hypothetical protein